MLSNKKAPSETTHPERSEARVFLTLAAISLALPFLLFLAQGNVLFGLADEGFLWYGAWRTALGEIPTLDFQSYDPGRYYWTAPWISIFGNGIETVRVSATAFKAIGLFFGLLVLRRINKNWWFVVLSWRKGS